MEQKQLHTSAERQKQPISMVFDMETQDPDDFLTLLLLLGHPDVDLKAITVTPGTPQQIGVVRHALKWFAREYIPVGAFNLEHPKECVSAWHYKVFGDIPPSFDAERGGDLLHEVCGPQTTLVTGAPLKNLGQAIQKPNFTLGRWVAQGGFAGEGVVPAAKQLPKFSGLATCPTFNLNGDPKSALAALAHPGIELRHFVSKNVCHRVYYDQSMHEAIRPLKDRSLSLQKIWQGMDSYLQKKSEGKRFHDPLAACCAIDPRIGQWAQVEMYREGDRWGARLSEDSNTWIITDYDATKFFNVLTASSQR
ncbi:MAG: nucleoside hydrolase [Pseudomonadota bacterium]